MDCSMPGFPVHHQLLEIAQTYVPRVGDSICHSLLVLPSIFRSIRFFPMSQFFASGSQSIGVSVSASASVLPMNIQGRFPLEWTKGWLDLLAVQGILKTLKSLLQHHGSKVSILQRSTFFIVQLSHPYMTAGKKQSFDYMELCWQSNVSAF